MKKFLLIISFVSLLFVGCDKNDSEDEKPQVTISVSDNDVSEKKAVTVTANLIELLIKL